MRLRGAMVVAAVLFGCGGPGLPGPEAGGPPEVREHEEAGAKSLWPLTAGSSWTYRITDPLMGVFEKTVTVEGMKPVPGTDATAVAVRSVQPHLEELSYQVVSAGIVYRIREEDLKQGQLVRVMSWNPSVMKALADPQAAGWTNSATVIETERDGADVLVDEREKVFVWSVAAVGETVQTPAGTFDNAIRLVRERSDKDNWVRTYWLVPGIGKVLEEGERTEELLQFTVR